MTISSDAELHRALADVIAYANSPIQAPTPTRKRITFLGDSLIAIADWAGLFPEYDVVNLGISGDTIQNIRANRVQSAIDSCPAVCFIMGGKNDIEAGRTPDQISDDQIAVAQALKDAGIRPVILSNLYVSASYVNYSMYAAAINQINSLQYNKGQSLGILALNILDTLCTNNALDPTLTYDGCHLTPAGFAVEAWNIRGYLKSNPA